MNYSFGQRSQTALSWVNTHLLRPSRHYLGWLLDLVATEYCFRLQRRSIRQILEATRQLPQNLHLEGTNICNAKCVFCAYPQMERAKETMPMEQFRRIVDEYVAMGGKYVSLTPIVGDPFVDRDLFQRLDDLYQRPQIEGFDFYTNGILMKRQLSEKLLRYGDKLHIQVSWGGFDRQTYHAIMGVDYFDLVRRNIEAFIEAKRKAGSSMRFSLALRCPPSNWVGDFWEQCQHYIQEGLLDLQKVVMFDSWAGKVDGEALKNVGLEAVLPPYKRGACELLFRKPVVLANGKVNACACRDVEAELIIGDLNESSLAEIWTGHAIDELIDRHERGDFPDVCKRCTWYTSIYNPRKCNARINKAALAAMRE
ncbi:MAG: radical SAM protein [Lyngbya sp. HA4199-MV5]|nr:radical SAM protein [Lyngbya sp. HA4199-MV5]